jgi:serine/threonine protein kinase
MMEENRSLGQVFAAVGHFRGSLVCIKEINLVYDSRAAGGGGGSPIGSNSSKHKPLSSHNHHHPHRHGHPAAAASPSLLGTFSATAGAPFHNKNGTGAGGALHATASGTGKKRSSTTSAGHHQTWRLLQPMDSMSASGFNSRDVKKELKAMKDLRHDNINPFIGASLEGNRVVLVMEYCSKGSLMVSIDVLIPFIILYFFFYL